MPAAMKKQHQKQKTRLKGPSERPSAQTFQEITYREIFLADHRDEEHHEYSRLTLCFSDKGPHLLEDVFTPGWSAGNYGGGTVRTDLPKGFYIGQTPETFAEHFGERFREQIRQNAELAAFLDEANCRHKR